MATTKTTAPSGCTIARNGNVFTLSWKVNAKNTNDGQKRRWKRNNGKWYTKSLTKNARQTSVTLTNESISSVTIQVQDNQKKDGKKIKDLSPSKWAGATFTFSKPPKPVASLTLSSDYWNRCILSYGHKGNAFSSTDNYGFLRTYYQTTFHSEKTSDSFHYNYVQATDITSSNFKNKRSRLYRKSGDKYISVKNSSYSSSTTYYRISTLGEAGSFDVTEDTAYLGSDLAYVRKYRFRILGRAGYNKDGWVTCSHYYSKPYIPKVKTATVSNNEQGGINCSVVWASVTDTFHPIDYTTVQYGVAVPAAGMTCPPNISWNDRPSMKDTTYDDADSFSLDTTIGTDECLFVRVCSVHDHNISRSSPKLATGIVTMLTTPSSFSVEPNYNTYRAAVNVTNESEVPDSRIAIVYHSVKDGVANDQVVGVIDSETSLPATIQCPKWDEADEWSLGAYAFVGDTSYNTMTFEVDSTTYTYYLYEITNPKMKSDYLWEGGDVPKAPGNVVVAPYREGAAVVTWNWTWHSADIAELSWSDHEDAWESTDQPETYRISNTNASKWIIYGLESGITWYIRVRLIKTTTGGENPGPWCSIKPLDMSSAPNAPILNVSKSAVTHNEPVTVSWTYDSTDGTDQKDAYLVSVTETDAGVIQYGSKIGTNRSVDIIPDNVGWTNGQTYGFALKVVSESDKHSEWSKPEFVTVAEPLVSSIDSTSFKKRYLYALAEDTEVDENKTYYTVSATAVEDPDINDIATYYENVENAYILTDDGVIDDEKTYYTVEGTQVTTPSEEYLSTYYTMAEINILDEMPITLSASVTGGIGGSYSANVSIERAESYFVDRPDETTYHGFKGETVYSDSIEDVSAIAIDQADLIGFLDDTAFYRLTIYISNELCQVAESSVDFVVNWAHQAFIPDAEVTFDPSYSVVKIKPLPNLDKYQEGDTFDIYRLSVDKPVLIVKGGTFGETYVDPYPTIGEYGGHRVVTVTANGDFISNEEDSDMAWKDFGAEEGDIFLSDFPIVNYAEGSFEILYNADLSTNWSKDFRETRYLGGHIQGDWNAGIHRDSTINSVILREEDVSSVVSFRRMAEYPGVCHIRTLDGSNYYADIQVNEAIPYDETPTTSYSFKITRVDSDGYDGIELSEWNRLISG